MWSLWFLPLILMTTLAGLVIGIVTFIIRRQKTGHWFDGKGIAALIGAPLGCMALPVIGLFALILLGSGLQSSDQELYAEIFGYHPAITDDRLLFDDFGYGADRAIYMRAEVNPAEHRRLLMTPGLSSSAMTIANFDAAGEARDFSWWWADGCLDANVYSADGHRDWGSLTLLDCRSQSLIYVVAIRSAR
jgi:hypothetical protein